MYKGETSVDVSPDRVNKGVHAPSHVINITDCESRDADYSVSHTGGDSCDTNKVSTDTDGGYYKLHMGKKNFKSPRKIEFERVKQIAPKVKIRRKFLPKCSCMHHPRNCHKQNFPVGQDPAKGMSGQFPFTNLANQPLPPRPKNNCLLSFLKDKLTLPCLRNRNNKFNYTNNMNNTMVDDLEISGAMTNTEFNNNNNNKTNNNNQTATADNDEKYFFDRGNVDYFHTTDCPPHLVSEMIARQTSLHATRFWAEIFGSINIGVIFVVSFVLQLYRFVLYSLFRSLIVGLLQISSDYFLKPLLAIFFNGFLQPPLTFIQNIFSALANVSEEIARILENGFKPLTQIIGSFRLVEINRAKRSNPPTVRQAKEKEEIIEMMKEDN